MPKCLFVGIINNNLSITEETLSRNMSEKCFILVNKGNKGKKQHMKDDIPKEFFSFSLI
jgi:hypothetical protein